MVFDLGYVARVDVIRMLGVVLVLYLLAWILHSLDVR
jgi:hypothetical protein